MQDNQMQDQEVQPFFTAFSFGEGKFRSDYALNGIYGFYIGDESDGGTGEGITVQAGYHLKILHSGHPDDEVAALNGAIAEIQADLDKVIQTSMEVNEFYGYEDVAPEWVSVSVFPIGAKLRNPDGSDLA